MILGLLGGLYSLLCYFNGGFSCFPLPHKFFVCSIVFYVITLVSPICDWLAVALLYGWWVWWFALRVCGLMRLLGVCFDFCIRGL